jgi:hypothetical protein
MPKVDFKFHPWNGQNEGGSKSFLKKKIQMFGMEQRSAFVFPKNGITIAILSWIVWFENHKIFI